MKNWMIAIFALLLFAGCTKYTTPHKVEKRIVKGTWKISIFTIEGTSVASQYSTYTFVFNDSKSISVGGGITASGTWQVGLGKNPAILYLNFPPVGGLEYLADDWQVTEMQKDLMRLKLNDSNGMNSTLVFKK